MTQREQGPRIIRRNGKLLALFDLASVQPLVDAYVEFKCCDPTKVELRRSLRKRVDDAYALLRPAQDGEPCIELLTQMQSYLTDVNGVPVDGVPDLQIEHVMHAPITPADGAN